MGYLCHPSGSVGSIVKAMALRGQNEATMSYSKYNRKQLASFTTEDEQVCILEHFHLVVVPPLKWGQKESDHCDITLPETRPLTVKWESHPGTARIFNPQSTQWMNLHGIFHWIICIVYTWLSPIYGFCWPKSRRMLTISQLCDSRWGVNLWDETIYTQSSAPCPHLYILWGDSKLIPYVCYQ